MHPDLIVISDHQKSSDRAAGRMGRISPQISQVKRWDGAGNRQSTLYYTQSWIPGPSATYIQ
jgi:hypothetical protein